MFHTKQVITRSAHRAKGYLSRESGTTKAIRGNTFTMRSDCKECPIKTAIIGKSHEKIIGFT